VLPDLYVTSTGRSSSTRALAGGTRDYRATDTFIEGGPGPVSLTLRKSRLAFAWAANALACPGLGPDPRGLGSTISEIWTEDVRRAHAHLVQRLCNANAVYLTDPTLLAGDRLLYLASLQQGNFLMIKQGAAPLKRRPLGMNPVHAMAGDGQTVFIMTDGRRTELIRALHVA
jgi:hypothetical protein